MSQIWKQTLVQFQRNLPADFILDKIIQFIYTEYIQVFRSHSNKEIIKTYKGVLICAVYNIHILEKRK